MNDLLFKQKPQLFVRSARSPGFVQFCAVFGVLRSPTAGPIRAISCSFGSCTKRMLSCVSLAKSRFSAFSTNGDPILVSAPKVLFGSAPDAVFHLRTTRAKCQHPKNPIAARLANAPKTPTGRSTLIYKTITVLASIVCGFRSFSARWLLRETCPKKT